MEDVLNSASFQKNIICISNPIEQHFYCKGRDTKTVQKLRIYTFKTGIIMQIVVNASNAMVF